MCHRLDWPVRTLSFSHDGKMLASASEDHFIDIAEVETGQCDRLWVFVCCISQRSSQVLHQFKKTKRFDSIFLNVNMF